MPVYKTKLKVHGQFNTPDFDKLNIAEKDILWQRAFISVMLADKRGLNEIPVLRWNDKSFIFGPAEKVIDTYSSIVQTDLKDIEIENKSYNTFSFDLDVRGSRLLRFLPFGKQTQAFVQSNWKTPKFIGTSLPLSHTIKESGFKAQWKTLELNRNYPQQWRSSDFGIEALNSSIFGVEFLMPVSVYQQTNRSVKYAVLFVVLTFISYFLFEILAKLRIHPVQYLLIGLSVCLFYLNLLSISEHLNFELAYLLSSTATILMASGYSVAVLKSRSKALIIAFILTVLYGFLFILLNAETYSLLMGGIGLFIILGTIMFVTRKMEWYSTPAIAKD